MTYNEFIQNIIDTRGQWNIPEGEYYEMHHIIPKCLNGCSDYKKGTFKKRSHNENCIWLYPKEHYIAHKLLAEENKDNSSLITAWWMMSHCKKGKVNRQYEISAEEYEEARILYAQFMSVNKKGKKWSEESKKKLSLTKKGKPNYKLREYMKNMPETHKKNISNGKLGKKLSQKTKDKISKALKGKGHPISKETKVKMSNSHKGRKNSEEHNKNIAIAQSKPVFCIETNEQFRTANIAAKKYHCDKHNISKCCNGERELAANLHWKWV